MGWNGSNLGNPRVLKQEPKTSRIPTWIFRLGILVLICGICTHVVMRQVSRKPKVPSAKERPMTIPSPISRRTETPPSKPTGVTSEAAAQTRPAVLSTATSADAAQARVIRRVITNSVSAVKSRIEFFNHCAESELAFLTCLPLGTPVIGQRDFDEDFISDLKASLKETIVIQPDDPDDIAYYKNAVIEVKKELKELFDKGEDVAATLSETRKELQKLGVYKQQIEVMINKAQSESELTDADMNDLISAANAMLEEKGIEPLVFNPVTRAIIKQKPFPKPEDLETEEPEDEME